ncbi:hypothetical protein E2C01_078178 [Portunus trituberculatus]|uniref:Uncharacterized protein n=1 Tax=Portunus trituberculatus TaxID=210409 RepID=A0A5B7IPH4_PORTR|nr:hypothetical protein [Portunus trituberculatus]
MPLCVCASLKKGDTTRPVPEHDLLVATRTGAGAPEAISLPLYEAPPEGRERTRAIISGVDLAGLATIKLK